MGSALSIERVQAIRTDKCRPVTKCPRCEYLSLVVWRDRRPELGQRGLSPVNYAAGTVAELVERYSAAGLKLTAEVADSAANLPLVAQLLAAVLAAAHRNDIAEVGFTAQVADEKVQVRTAARTIDRSVAIRFAHDLQLLELRREVETARGTILRAHTRFAVFHFDVDLPLT